jgi:hypothetical protein
VDGHSDDRRPNETHGPDTDQTASAQLRRIRSGSLRVARRPWVLAALVVIPYLILMLTWVFSNPPGAAPDEPSHLVKALGMASLDIGTKFTGTSTGGNCPATEGQCGHSPRVQERGDSLARDVEIPARLSPAGYTCEAFRPSVSAACLSNRPAPGHGTLKATTALGSYPPAMYVPIGIAAISMPNAADAFLAGRGVSVVVSALLLWIGAAQLIKWLGREALLGAFVGLTPMAVFSSSIVSTSGIEICSAFALSCIGIVAIRRPESIAQPKTQALLAIVGSVLILSRQLGVVTFSAIVALVVLRIGWRPVLDLIREHRPVFLASVAVLIAAVTGIYWWERRFDHPDQIGSVFNGGALANFSQAGFAIVRSAIGQFGWLDTPLFRWGIAAWLILAIVLIGMAILLGDSADRWSLVGWLVATWAVAFVTFATVFYPIGAGEQGRHMLPFFVMCPVLAGLVVVEKLRQYSMAAVRRIFGLVAAVMSVLQLASLYVNTRRYAVGANGPFWFVGKSQWHPPAGWDPWAILAILGTVLLAGVILACRPNADVVLDKEPQDVER